MGMMMKKKGITTIANSESVSEMRKCGNAIITEHGAFDVLHPDFPCRVVHTYCNHFVKKVSFNNLYVTICLFLQ